MESDPQSFLEREPNTSEIHGRSKDEIDMMWAAISPIIEAF
jgi:hypothetical protein